MRKWITITFLLLLINNIDQCSGNSHLITGFFTNSALNGSSFIDRVLFVRSSTSPKSYVVGFIYVGDAFSNTITSGTIYSDAQNTRGGGDSSNGFKINDNHYLDAHIHIPNARNFQVRITVQGLEGVGSIPNWLGFERFKPRCSALICTINTSQPQTKYRKLIYGERKANDVILYAQQSFSSADEKMPRHKIEFQDDNAIITAVVIKLNSTKAIVFRNKVEFTEHRFSGTVYGLNRDTITDVVIIYGHKPKKFNL